jgi:putative ABC transport system permease protein
VIASLGVYGVLAYSVSQRTREIGVRIALGATPGSVLRLIVREGTNVVLIGIGTGLVAGWRLAEPCPLWCSACPCEIQPPSCR